MNQQFNEGHVPELLDRIWCIQQMAETLLEEHPALCECKVDGEYENVQVFLSKMYQKVGEMV